MRPSRAAYPLLLLLAGSWGACNPAEAQDSASISSADAAGRPNVLLIISDDLRTELGCYGVARARTPHLDSLAAAGVRFERAYCQFPLCNPSRTSMLTGRRPVTTGVYGNREWFGRRHPEFVSLPRWFKDHGYTTLRAGKIFHGGLDDADAWSEGGEPRRLGALSPTERGGSTGRSSPLSGVTLAQQAVPRPDTPTAPRRGRRANRGAPRSKAERSDRWVVMRGDGSGQGDARTADRAIAMLDSHRGERFFLACGFAKPHSPPAAPQSFYDLYDTDSIELPADFAQRPTVPAGFPAESIRPRNSDLFIGREATPRLAREMTRAYLASVSWMDSNVGRVVAALDRLNLRSETIIVFWGDHGYQLGEKGKWSKAGSLWEQGTRVPLIVVAPGVAGNGRSSPRVVESIDIYPTLVELCGLPEPAGLEGRSLAPLLQQPDAPWDHPAYTIWSEDGRGPTGVAVRTERWRYAEFGEGSAAMLLDEAADPHETTNLADVPEHARTRAELSALVRTYRSSANSEPARGTSRP